MCPLHLTTCAGNIAYVHGRPGTAADELDTLAVRYERSSDALAALYWAGRAWERHGDSARAVVRWNQLLARDPLVLRLAALPRHRLD